MARAHFHPLEESGKNAFEDDPVSQIRSRVLFKAFPGPKSTPELKTLSKSQGLFVGPFLLKADFSNLSRTHDSRLS
jgi:hypothetical protein